MIELITELVRKENGLYDIVIHTKDGKVLLDVRGIRKRKAYSLIDETEQKVDEG